MTAPVRHTIQPGETLPEFARNHTIDYVQICRCFDYLHNRVVQRSGFCFEVDMMIVVNHL